ncbi:uncharacterized protein [Acropora muricata]|uniref:uncharacterized protein n=1 Tax=Acropora muricata TaxID=159855 RepID=UPI0034E5D5D2
MALPSLEKLEMNSSTPDHMKADSSGPENTWQQIFKSCSTHHHGFVDSIEQAMVLQKKYELETTTKFSCYKSDKLFGSGDPFSKPRKIFFKDDRVPFDGIPFMTIVHLKYWIVSMVRTGRKMQKTSFRDKRRGIIHLKERGFCPKTLLSLAALQRSLCQKLYDLQVTRLQITQSDSDEACLIDLGLM